MLSPSEIVVSRVRPERQASVLSADITSPPEPTPSIMAERFAPGGQKDAGENSPRGEVKSPAAYTVNMQQARLPAANRWLLIASIAVSLVPTAIILALIWQGAIRFPQGAGAQFAADQEGAPERLQASLAAVPAIPRNAVELDVKPADIALTVPASIEAKTGEAVPFDIAIDSADALPARSLIAIRALPNGASFTQGRPYADTEWNLRPDEIGDLALMLPERASGTSDLRIELMAADGTVLASATTRLEIAPEPNSGLILRSDESGRIAGLIEHGEKMIAVGYLAGARAYFKRAAEAGSGEAALKLGATYDPDFIDEIGALGVKADPKEARAWYERAKQLGVEGADLKLKALKNDWNERQTPGAAAEADDQQPGPAETVANAATSAPIPVGKDAWVSLLSYANVRTAPSSTADTLRVAEKGARFRATGRSGNWVQITDPKTSEVGWVYSRFIETAE